MLSGSKNFLWLIPLLLLVTSPLWKPVAVRFLSPHGHHSVKISRVQTDSSFKMTGMQLVRSDDGQKDLELHAATVNSGKEGMDNFYLSSVDLRLYDKGKNKAHVLGGEGHYDAKKQIITVIDNVTVYARGEYELRSDVLRYLMPYKTIKTAAAVFFQTKDTSVRGDSMSYNLSTGRYRVGGGVICDFQ